jgi:hypothetical protein
MMRRFAKQIKEPKPKAEAEHNIYAHAQGWMR